MLCLLDLLFCIYLFNIFILTLTLYIFFLSLFEDTTITCHVKFSYNSRTFSLASESSAAVYLTFADCYPDLWGEIRQQSDIYTTPVLSRVFWSQSRDVCCKNMSAGVIQKSLSPSFRPHLWSGDVNTLKISWSKQAVHLAEVLAVILVGFRIAAADWDVASHRYSDVNSQRVLHQPQRWKTKNCWQMSFQS